jgi:hypothetical protein
MNTHNKNLSIKLSNFKINRFKSTQSGFFGGTQAHKLLIGYLEKKIQHFDNLRLYSQNIDLINQINLLKNINPKLKIQIFSKITFDEQSTDNFQKCYQLQKWYNTSKQIVILDNQNINGNQPLINLLHTIIKDKWLNLQLIFVHQKVNQMNKILDKELDHYFVNRYDIKNTNVKEIFTICDLTRHFRFNFHNRNITDDTLTLYFSKNKKTIEHCDQFIKSIDNFF